MDVMGRSGPIVWLGLGALLGAGGLWLARSAPTPAEEHAPLESNPERHEPPAPAPATTSEACEAPVLSIRPPTTTERPKEGPFAEGTARLYIGDGYVFGEDHAQPGVETGIDIVCIDLRGVLTLSCPHGAVAADVPLGAIGMPERAEKAAILLVDAPKETPQRFATLSVGATAQQSGLALIRAMDRRVFKVWLVQEVADVHALRRSAVIGYSEVPEADGGGVLHLSVTKGLADKAGPTQATIKEMETIGRSIPGSSFSNFISGAYTSLDPPPDTLRMEDERFLLLQGPLRSRIEIPRRGAVYAAHGIDRGGIVSLESYSGVAAEGDMAGQILVKSYAFLYLKGNLVGEVDCGSYATVVIDGDIVGTLKVRSYVTLLLRGRILGKIDPSGACWSTFYFAGFRSQAELAGMSSDFGQVTLHVEQSDAPQGKVTPPPGNFREVIVSDPVWSKIRKR